MTKRNKKDYNKAFEDRVHSMEQRSSASQGGLYWWVAGKLIKKGRVHTVLIGPEVDEDTAHRLGYEKFGGGEFECLQFPTRSISAATQMYKARRLKGGVTVEVAVERVRHRGKDIDIQ